MIQEVKAVEVRNINDIKVLLEKFKPIPNRIVEFQVDVPWSSDGKPGVGRVSGVSDDSNIYKMLIDGFELVRRRREAQESIKEKMAQMEGPLTMQAWDVDNLTFPVDAIINKRLGGKRKGMRVRWEIEEGTYEWDPFINKLFKVGT